MDTYDKEYSEPGRAATGLTVEELFSQAKSLWLEQNARSVRSRKLSVFRFLLEHCRVGAIDAADRFPVFGFWGRSTWGKIYYHELWEHQHKSMLAPYADLFDSGDVIAAMPDFAHSVPDWRIVLSMGFSGLLQRAKEKAAAYFAHHAQEPAKTEFFSSVIGAYEAILSVLARMAAAERAHGGSPELIQALEHLINHPAENFYQALLQIWLFYQIAEYADGIQTRSFGNLDQLLYPFYLKDKERGCTEEHFRRILRNFMSKVSAMHYYWGHPFYLGGTGKDGGSLINELSYLILDEHDQMGIYDPKIQFKVNVNTPVDFLKKALDMIRRGHNSIVFVGEPAIMRAMLKAGYSEEEARNAVIKGCYEYTDSHSAVVPASACLFLPQIVMNTLKDSQAVTDFESFMQCLQQKIETICQRTREIANRVEAIMDELNPSLLLSGVNDRALEEGVDGYAWGTNHNNSDVWVIAPACACDCLCALQKFVFDQKRISIPELLTVLENNWKDHELLRLEIANDEAKYGNHCKAADAILKRLLGFITQNVNGKPNSRGGFYATALHCADWFRILSKDYPATPEGRHANDELSKNMSPQPGQCKRGPLALLQSNWALDSSDFMGGIPVDIMLHPSAVSGDEGLDAMVEMVRAHVRNFGHAIQFNILTLDCLEEAMQNPDKYKDLQIRVCGWNVLWNNLSKDEQKSYMIQAKNLC